MPSFLDKHSRYTLEVVGFCLLLRYYSHLSSFEICRKLKSFPPGHTLARSTIRNWRRRYEARGREGIKVLSKELLLLDPRSCDFADPPLNEESIGKEFIRVGGLLFEACHRDKDPPERLFEFLNLFLFEKTGRGLLAG